MSGRIRLAESCSRPPEEIVRELYEDVFGPPPREDDDAAGDDRGGDAPGEPTARQERAATR